MTTAADVERVGAAGDCVTCEEYSNRMVCRGCYEKAQKYAQACEWALQAEQEYTARLKADLALECQEVAERQREACARYMDEQRWYTSRAALSAPLVTEGAK